MAAMAFRVAAVDAVVVSAAVVAAAVVLVVAADAVVLGISVAEIRVSGTTLRRQFQPGTHSIT